MPGADISQKNLAHQMAMLEDIEEAHLISGEWDILLKVRGSSIKEIGDLVIDKIRVHAWGCKNADVRRLLHSQGRSLNSLNRKYPGNVK